MYVSEAMTPTDIDALARLLDGDPTLNGEATDETRLLGIVAHHLASGPPQRAAPEFTAQLRATLVEAARVQALPAGPSRARARFQRLTERWRRSVRVVTGTASAILLLSTGGMAVAADQALPSDALYSAKLALEDVRIAMVRGDLGRGEAQLEQASSRIAEAEAVAPEGDSTGAARALLEADDAARSGASRLLRTYEEQQDESAVARLLDFTNAEQRRLEDLDTVLTGDAAEAAEVLAVALERIEARLVAMHTTSGLPTARDGFDLSIIPPAHEAFEACPCEPVSTDTPGSPVQEPPTPTPAAVPEPPVAEEPPPPAPPALPETPTGETPTGDLPAGETPVEQPVPEPPALDPPPTSLEPPALPLPEVREPLRDTSGTFIDRIIDSVLDVFR